MEKCWAAIIWAYLTLRDHKDYWLFDRDYKRKFEILEEAATNFNKDYTNDTVEYMASIAEYMFEAHSRIFG